MPELDRLKEEVAFLKFWQGTAVVIVVSLAGWLVTVGDSAPPLTFGLAIAGVVSGGIGILLLYRQISRRIDRVGDL